MKLILTEKQYKMFNEMITEDEVICDKCDWSWDLSDGGDDPYICHKCGYDNENLEFTGLKVMVYYNLHKKTFSIQHKGLVVAHADYVKLNDVEFRVRKTGKEKVRDEKRKNVHAFVVGKLEDFCKYPCENLPEESEGNIITYDPYKYDSFVYKDSGEPIQNATEVEMINRRNKIFIIKENF